MGQNHVRAAALVEAEQATVFTPSVASSESTALTVDNKDSSVPGPGATYVIRSVSTGKYISLQDEEISLSAPGGNKLIRWDCSQYKDWVTFKEPTSGRFLQWEGSESKKGLTCSTEESNESKFYVRPKLDGSYALLSYIHPGGLYAVGVETVDGNEGFTVIKDCTSASTSWQFIKVGESAAE